MKVVEGVLENGSNVDNENGYRNLNYTEIVTQEQRE